MTYLTQFRIKLSLQLLADPEFSIAAAADRVGIPDASYFGQIFKNLRGVTPTEYRNNLFSYRHGTDLAEPSRQPAGSVSWDCDDEAPPSEERGIPRRILYFVRFIV